jgi:hypothetical protein
VRSVAGGAHDGDDLFHLRWVGRIAQTLVAWCATGVESRQRRRRSTSTGTVEQKLGHDPSSGLWTNPTIGARQPCGRPGAAARYPFPTRAAANTDPRALSRLPRSGSTVTQPSSSAALPLVVRRQQSGFSRTCVLWSGAQSDRPRGSHRRGAMTKPAAIGSGARRRSSAISAWCFSSLARRPPKARDPACWRASPRPISPRPAPAAAATCAPAEPGGRAMPSSVLQLASTVSHLAFRTRPKSAERHS